MALDWTQLTDPLQALKWRIKTKNRFDSYQKKNQFVARVLFADSVYSQVTQSEILSTFGTLVSGDSIENIYKFRGRIVGLNSPHSFLPDPCNPDFIDDEALTKDIIDMHTLFYVFDSPELPEVNSYWSVTLRPSGCPGAPFNLQFARALKRLQVAEDDAELTEKECESLEDLDWAGADPLRSNANRGTGYRGRAAHRTTGAYIPEMDLVVDCPEYMEAGERNANGEMGGATKGVVSGLYQHPLMNADVEEPINHGAYDLSHYAGHTGFDFVEVEDGAHVAGAPIYAIYDGVVAFTTDWSPHVGAPPPSRVTRRNFNKGGKYYGKNSGNSVVIDQDDGCQAWYCHFEESPNIKAGAKIEQGQQIGTLGSTGFSVSNHMHLQVKCPVESYEEYLTYADDYTGQRIYPGQNATTGKWEVLLDDFEERCILDRPIKSHDSTWQKCKRSKCANTGCGSDSEATS